MGCCLRPLDSAMHETTFSRRPAEGRNDIRKVRASAVVKDARAKV